MPQNSKMMVVDRGTRTGLAAAIRSILAVEEEIQGCSGSGSLEVAHGNEDIDTSSLVDA